MKKKKEGKDTNEFVVVVESRSGGTVSLADALDHLLVGDAEVLVVEQGDHHRMLRVCVDHRASITKQVRVEEERSALAGFEALFWWWIAKNLLFGSEDEEILGFHPLLLDTRWSNVYQVADDDDDDEYFCFGFCLHEKQQKTYSCLMEMPPPVPVTQPW